MPTKSILENLEIIKILRQNQKSPASVTPWAVVNPNDAFVQIRKAGAFSIHLTAISQKVVIVEGTI